MKVMIKKLIDGKFEMVKLEDVVGKSISDFCCNADAPVVVAMFVEGEDKPGIIFSNSEHWVDNYLEKGITSFLAKDIRTFLQDEVKHGMIAKEFPGGEFIEIGKAPEQSELF